MRVSVYDGKHHTRRLARRSRSSPPGRKAFIAAIARGARRSCSSRSCDVDDHRARPRRSATSPATCRHARARVSGTGQRCRAAASRSAALVPLAELQGYQSRLKAMTGGAGTLHDGRCRHYDPVPPHVQQQLVGQHEVKKRTDPGAAAPGAVAAPSRAGRRGRRRLSSSARPCAALPPAPAGNIGGPYTRGRREGSSRARAWARGPRQHGAPAPSRHRSRDRTGLFPARPFGANHQSLPFQRESRVDTIAPLWLWIFFVVLGARRARSSTSSC
ncbi:MAG: hypothetical protein MZW92_47120 [Comamonadaceae bacterium]|nr:hypothetical protein [Comamonadaceae bacterium]